MRARNKLNVRQLPGLTKPGIYSDGGDLYLRVRDSGSRSWVYIYRMDGKRREMGLGSDLDISLAKARDRASAARELVLEGQDPLLARQAAKVAAAPPKPVETFGRFAMDYLDTVEDGFKNAKLRLQWRSTLVNYAKPMFEVPISEVNTDRVLEVLQPI